MLRLVMSHEGNMNTKVSYMYSPEELLGDGLVKMAHDVLALPKPFLTKEDTDSQEQEATREWRRDQGASPGGLTSTGGHGGPSGGP